MTVRGLCTNTYSAENADVARQPLKAFRLTVPLLKLLVVVPLP